MQPYYDMRGCPRWQWNGAQVVYIPVLSRAVPQDVINKAWADLARWRALGTDAALSGNAALTAYYNQMLATYQAVYDNLTRPGQASDDPGGAPARSVVTPQ